MRVKKQASSILSFKTWRSLYKMILVLTKKIERFFSLTQQKISSITYSFFSTAILTKISINNKSLLSLLLKNIRHHLRHSAVAAVMLTVLFIGIFQSVIQAAPDLSDTWDLSNPLDYTYDPGIEMLSGDAKLKAQNYNSDTDTSALYHFDEAGGISATDSSSHTNDATIAGGSFITGNLNNALSLDGINDTVTVENTPSLQLDNNQTVEAWTKFSSAFSAGSHDEKNTIVDKGDYQLYYDNETGKLTYELRDNEATTWTQAAGDDINGSWDRDGNLTVESTAIIGTNLYAGLGSGTGDAEVWRWNGTRWDQVAGDGLNNCWPNGSFETVSSMTSSGSDLYVGLGNSAGDAEVWSWDGSTWSKIGGDAINSSWQVSTFEYVYSMTEMNDSIYAGLGSSANDAEVWRWNGATWSKIGGDSLNSGWTTNFENVGSLSSDGTNIYAGLGASAGDAEVWRWNGATWSKIGGDSLNASWADTTYEYALSMTFMSGTLYVGLGTTADEAEVWSWNGSTWTMLGGDSINSSWGAGYEAVYSLTNDGTNIYAGLGASAGDNEVWSWNGAAWSKIGGDAINSGFTNNLISVKSLVYGNGSLFASLNSTSASLSGQVWSWNGSSWSRIAGDYVNFSWGFRGLRSVEAMQVSGNYLYAGTGVATVGHALVWRFDGTSWVIVGGQGVNGSWAYDTYEAVTSMTSINGFLYVGLGSSANDAEVWSWNGATWSKIGGDSLNNGWTTNYEEISAMTSSNGTVYVGLGNSANDAEVWSWNGSAWSKIGGDSTNSGWTTNFDRVTSLALYNNQLIAGLGSTTTEAEVWSWNGSAWSKIGGDGIANSWNTVYEQVDSLTVYGDTLVAGLGTTAGDAEVWSWDGTVWAQIGGDDINNSWTNGTYERVRAFAVYNGALVAGLGNSTGDGEVWSWDGNEWSKIGGNTINLGWANAIEEVSSFSPYQGKLYAGLGNTANADATIWAYGNNGYLQSTTNSFNTDWRHVAASYNGSTMSLYINGTLDSSLATNILVGTSDNTLYIGSGHGGREAGKPRARLEGYIDELRLSSVARTEFTTTAYSSAPQTISPNTSIRTSGIWHWDTFADTKTLNGGTITYRLSNDQGATWLYWDGLSWSTSASLAQSNLPTVVNDNFELFPVTFGGLRWQAILDGDGTQQVTLSGVDAQASSDSIDPTANPSAITAYTAHGGSSINPGDWTNGSSPYFTWTAGDDDESGVLGYCAYLGTDQTADPTTTKGLLGTSPTATDNNCPFIISGNELDLATASYLATPLTSSTDSVYLSLRTIDIAGNITLSSEQFSFKFDNTPPTNPAFITAPSGFINSKDVTLSWQTVGGSAPSDDHSGVTGLQYRVGPSGTWYGDNHTGTGDINDLLTNDGSYNTIPTPDHNDLVEGINTVYFRTWDIAGNYSSAYVTATLKINTTGAPSEPTNLTASPAVNTTNLFGFDWDSPNTFVGDASNITYCYSVNSLPSVNTCAFTAAGSTELTVGAYATQPGSNTMYVVARDESSNINYDNYASVSFTANTPSPGFPLNTDIVDVSIKNTSNWRLALTWDPPTSSGIGVSNYRVYRSINNILFNEVGSSSSTTYIDASLNQQTYYYKIAACDSTNNCGAPGSIVSALPTGKFTTPAIVISEPEVSDITTKRAKVAWATDRASDSKIAIGTASGQYSTSEIGNSDQVSDHSISLDNLSPGTTYYIVAKWTDEDGNTGSSQEKTFTTAPAPTIKEVVVSRIGLNSATIEFSTKGAIQSAVYYGSSESFGGLKEVNTSRNESRYQVVIDGLADGTKHFFMVSALDDEGVEYRGNIDSFITPARPRISNLRFQPVAGEPTSTQKVSWDTNVASTSQISYSVLNGTPTEIQDSTLVSEHEIVIKNLKDDSEYTLVATSRDSNGVEAVSDRQTFKTALDTRPPKISNVVTESSIRGTGSDARGQIVISWQTDEPSTSQVAYTEGSGAVTFNSKSAEDALLTTEHLVIISDLPTSRVFSVKPLSKDTAQNEGEGSVETAIIGRASDNALTVVFNTLKSIFGF